MYNSLNTHMESFNDLMGEYKSELKKGHIQEAYRNLMKYMSDLRTYFDKKYPNHFVSGSIYFGYMDMTYFSFIPKTMKHLKLKPAIVFLHETCRFEIWLAASNKKIQEKYWKLFKEHKWNRYHIPETIKGIDSIVEHVLVENPNFDDLNSLTKQIENESLEFIKENEEFISKL